MKIQRKINLNEDALSNPMALKELAQMYDVHRNTMADWLRKQIVPNIQFSPRRWRVPFRELPCDYDGIADNIRELIEKLRHLSVSDVKVLINKVKPLRPEEINLLVKQAKKEASAETHQVNVA